MIYKSKTISTIFFWQSSLYVNNAVFFSSTKWLNSLKLSFETYNVIVIQIEKKKLCSRNGMGFMRFSMGFFFYSGQYHQGIAVYAVDIRLCVTSLLGSVLCVILCASMCILQCLWITFLYDAISISCVMYWILVLCTKGKFQCINCIRDLMESFRTNCPFSKMKWFIFCCSLFSLPFSFYQRLVSNRVWTGLQASKFSCQFLTPNINVCQIICILQHQHTKSNCHIIQKLQIVVTFVYPDNVTVQSVCAVQNKIGN